jgi:hypothetical protein
MMQATIIPIEIDVRFKSVPTIFSEIGEEVRRGCLGFPQPRRVDLHSEPRLVGGKLRVKYRVSEDRDARRGEGSANQSNVMG